MTDTQHTPGPWFLTPEGYGVYKGDSYGDRGDMVCTLPGYGSDAATRIANARLIAAAPDLLAALEALLASDLVYWFPSGPPEGNWDAGQPAWTDGLKQKAAPVLAARAAIAKVTGA